MVPFYLCNNVVSCRNGSYNPVIIEVRLGLVGKRGNVGGSDSNYANWDNMGSIAKIARFIPSGDYEEALGKQLYTRDILT
jgi:hypothetical protein